MKKTLKILSWICTVVLLLGTVSVGMSAYAASDNVIGSCDFEITNVYKDIDWNNVTAYKSETHVHTVRSDADTEIDDMIHYYYDFGFDAMALTDHGTVNYGWDHDQARVVLYDYQWFVHGTMDQLDESDYKNIITGQRSRSINSGKGMMEIPLGIEWNGASTKKYHVNGYYADAGHGDLSILDNQDDAILGAIKENYKAGGFSHVNHVGEWSGGNDEKEVYSEGWVRNFASYFQNYCPNRGGRNVAAQTDWMNSHKGKAGVVGMELVNTADSRTHNDRRYVYDEILKILAPQGINVFGFCEDDAHELSDCDRNAQYFLINNNKDTVITSSLFDRSNNESGKTSDYKNNDSDPIDKVQNYYRDAMFYGEFYASSKNSKNSYELGNGFNAVGDYPSISNISVDNEKDQISVSFKDATKVRLVADGTIIETVKTGAGQNTVVFDLNKYETQINSYVRIYLTGAGGITYLQPFLITKTQSTDPTVQFVGSEKDEHDNYKKLVSDAEVVVKDSNGSVVSDSLAYENFFYILPVGDYTYTATRRGYQPATGSFSVTQADYDAGKQTKIPITFEESSEVSYAYFYAPETIYLSTDDNKTFDKYIDRENAVNGALHNSPQNTGNLYFHREDATDVELSFNVIEGDVLIGSLCLDSAEAIGNSGGIPYSGDTISTSITSGRLEKALSNNQHVLIKWTAKYKIDGVNYETSTYSYVYKTPTGESGTSFALGAGAYVKTKKNVTSWTHSTMYVAASIYAFGINKLEHNNTNDVDYAGYKFAPCTGYAFDDYSTSLTIPGQGYIYKSKDSSGGSEKLELINNDIGYIYVDRSRVNNWSQIPNLKIGFDFNDVTETTGKNGDSGSYGVARLLFDTTLTGAKDATYHDDDVMFNLYFPNNRSNYTEVTNYNLSDSNPDSTKNGSVSNCLESYGSKRLYMSDNSDPSKTLVKALPSASADEVTVPISAYVKGTKEGRKDEIALEIDLCLVNVDKEALRTELNNTIKDAFQEPWFENDGLYDNYQNVIKDAAKVLGNPGATAEEIENAKIALQEVYDNFELKKGNMTVKHYWRLNGNEAVIYAEPTIEYSYSDNLAASAVSITGYDYSNYFECFASEDGTNYHLVDSGHADFDLEFAEEYCYEWRFYYTPKEFDVSYNLMGADNAEDYEDTAYFGQSYTVASDLNDAGITPQRSGYQFKGWNFDADDKTYSSGQNFTWNYAEKGVFSAIWESTEYDVSYDVNGGQPYRVPDEYKKVHYGDTYTVYIRLSDDPEVSPVPERTGYNFVGWKLNGGEEIYNAGLAFTWDINADSTFVAQWEVAKYNVTFDLNASDAVLKSTSGETLANNYSIAVEYGKEYGSGLPTAERTGYTVEWYSDPNFTNNSKVEATTNVTIDANHVLYAKWTPIQYNITYNLNGGAVAGNNPTTYTIADDDILLKQPVRTGYTFVGWEGSDITTAEPNHTIVSGSTGDKTFTAKWDLNGYTITYNLDGGTNNANNPSSYKVSDTVTLESPTKDGYRFTGWTGSNGDSPEISVVIPEGSTDNKEYTANWELITYSITYNYNGIEDPQVNPTSYSIESDDITLINPERFGYTFGGWECNDDSLSGETVTIANGAVTGDLEFTANWVKNGAHRVTYVLNRGKIEGSNPASYEDGETFNIINPTRDGYTFAGWTKTAGSTSTDVGLNAKILATDNTDLTFTANWTLIPYTISYNLDGGRIAAAGTNPTTYNAETAAITLINPIKPGYTFNGWTGTDLNSASKVVTIATGSTGNRSYKATWKVNNYTVTYNFNGGADAGLIKSYTSETNAVIGAPVRPGYTFAGWSIEFADFTWLEGAIDSNGKFSSTTGSYYSDAVVLRSGSTYMLNSSVSGLKVYAFAKDGTFLGEMGSTFTASQDCAVYIAADGVSSADSLRSVKITVSGTKDSYAITAASASTLGSAGNMNMTANWSSEEYTITYEGCDGVAWSNGASSNPNPATYTYDSSDILIVNPVKDGYTFEGWSFEGNINKSAVIKNHSTGDRTYTAVFEKTAYTISYEGLEGATIADNPTSYYIDSSTITLNNPTKDGYTFEGWIGTGLNSASKSVSIASGSTGNKNYTATWTPLSYSLTYKDVSGATFSKPNPNSYTVETATFTLNAPVKDGAVFTGWKIGDSDEIYSTVTVEKGSTGAKTFTATWSYKDYTITYYLNGGKETANPTTYSVISDDISLKAPTKTGYTFTGWTGMGITSPTTSVVIKTGSIGNREYTANWQTVNYNIAYDLAGGQIADNANPATYNIESATITLKNPVKTGSIFAGWTGTDLAEPTMTVTIPRGSTGSRRYTATWLEDSYTITYTGIEDATFAAENATSYTAATNDFTLNNPSKRGYHFEGWSGTGISGSGISSTVTIPKGSTGNRTYKANWTLENYTITYELDGGTATMTNPTEYNIFSAAFTLYAPVRVGYEFAGWSSDYFADIEATVTVDPSTTTGDKNFVANWTTGNYTITLDPNGGTLPSGQSASISYTYDSADITIQNPTRSGYVFAGWMGTGLSNNVQTLVIPSGSTGNREYTAVWVSSNENKITYNLNGGEVADGENPTSFATDSGEFTLENPVKDGYKFDGWVIDYQSQEGIAVTPSGETPTSAAKYMMIDTANGGSAVLSAKWSPLSYKITYNLNGGSASSNRKTYTIEDSFTINNPVRTGYTFAGWTGTDLDSGKANTSVSVSNKTGNRTYTATWNEAEYSITYDYNGGSISDPNPTSYTVTTPSFTLNNPEKAGYTFSGWTGANGTTPQKTVTVSSGSTGSKNFVANFEIENYTITFYNVDMAAQTYTTEDADINIPNPTKAGYEFMGWQHKDAVNPEKNVVVPHGSSGNKEFTAQWKEIEYTITYILNGGVVSGTNPTTYTIESAKITLANPEKEGYVFLGWDTSDGATNQTIVEIAKGSTGDKTFTAKWGTAPYKISYVGLSADEVAILNLPTEYSTEESNPISNPIKAGYVFEGWTGTGLTAPTKNLVIPVGSTGNKTYTATWSVIDYNITYNLDGGTAASENPSTYNVDSGDIRLMAPRKSGMTFLGWTGSNGDVPQKDVVISNGSVGDKEFTANWTARENNLHRIYFRGYDNAKLYVRFGNVDGVPVAYDYIEVEIGKDVTEADNNYIFNVGNIDTTAGYKITGWDIDFNAPKYRDNEDDIIVHAKWTYGDDTFTVIVNGTEPYVEKSCSQYEKVTATTAYQNEAGEVFKYWIISEGDNAGEIASYYRNYSFYAHADLSVTAVYGRTLDSEVRAVTRITRIEGYDQNYDWFTPNSERSVGTELTLLQHGLVFTADPSIGSNSGALVSGRTGVYTVAAGTKSLTGSWSLSISNPYQFQKTSDTVYVRSYIIVVGEDKVPKTIYSSIKTYLNNEDITPNAKTPN